MEDTKEYSLKYQFNFHNINELKPEDSLTCTCSPIDSSNITTSDIHILDTSFTEITLGEAITDTDTTISDNTLNDTPITNSTITYSGLNNSSVDAKAYSKTGTLLTSAGFPLEFSIQLVYRKNSVEFNYTSVRRHNLSLQLCLHQPRSIPFLPPLLIHPTMLPVDKSDPHRPSWLNRRHIGQDQPARWSCTLDSPSYPDLTTRLQLAGHLRFQLIDEPQRLIENLPLPSEADWFCLPNEMIIAVLSQLPLAERVKARLVCRTWAYILDSGAWVWHDITHLETADNMRNDVSDYDGGRLNRVRHDKLLQAIQFLRSRKAPIRCLEYRTDNLTNYYQYLSSILSETGIRLKALYTSCHSLFGLDDILHPSLMQLLNAQPTIERLYLGLLPTRLLYLNTPLLQTWHHLRILSLTFYVPQHMDMMISQAYRLRALHGLGLRVSLSRDDWSAAEFSEELESKVPSLRRVQSIDWPISTENLVSSPSHLTPCGCSINNGRTARHLVFGTEKLSPSAAAYLLMPVHEWDRNAISHHHI